MKITTCMGLLTGLLCAATVAAGADTPAQPGPGPFQGGEVRIVSSSHQDTAWMDTPAACRQFRIEHNLLPALEMMRKDPNYTFCMECSLHLMELLEAHPELRDEVVQRMKEGRLEFGATYNQPYESWLSGEELVRQTYFGRRWITKNFPGCDAKVAFNPDPPARSLQMQQILAKAGIPYMFISRYHEGLYRWLSPDGTGVLLYTPAHYGNHLPFLNGNPESCAAAIMHKLEQQAPYYEKRQIPPIYCLVNSTDFSKPVSFNPLVEFWNSQAATGDTKPPGMKYSSIRGFFEAIDKPAAKFDTLMGERPDVWLYITGPTHERTSTVRREAARLLPAAETFTTMDCLLKGDFRQWPAKPFDQAWMDELYIDHGIGGNQGHITDEVFHRKVETAKKFGQAQLGQALASIAAQVKTDAAKGAPVIVFNDLSWSRSEAVELAIPAEFTGPMHVVDTGGNAVSSQETTLGEPDEVNVAAAALGSTATADSAYSSHYGAEKAIDGKWAVRDPDPPLGDSDKWNSAAATGPHWLCIDFGQARTIHKVVIRHEGVMGGFCSESKENSSDFQIQRADSAAGPWTDLVPPVVGNTASLTTHAFAPTSIRCLRLLVTKGAQAESYARIYEIQAFATAETKTRKLVFVAKDVPALGYKTYHLAKGAATAGAAVGPENDFYRVELAPGGIKSIYDKQRKREWLDTGKFLGGELFTMNSYSPGMPDAGEAGAVIQPIMDKRFDRVADHKPEWKPVEAGPVRSVWQLEQPLGGATAVQRLTLWRELPRLDYAVELREFNGTLWREFRMALPLALEKAQIAYEVPMGVVEIGKDEVPTTGGHAYGGLNYWQPCKEIRPRLVQNFIDASDASGGLTLSTSAAAFDWVDPTTDKPGSAPLLQPILLASRKSCNGSGNWYPQAGDHAFRFSLTAHDGGWRNGRKTGIGANHPLFPVFAKPAGKAKLPAAMSFASVSADNVIISTIKKCEDDNSVVVRAYDIEGKDSTATVKLFKPATAAEQTNILEENGKPLPVKAGTVELPVGHHAIETIKVKF